MSDKTITVTVEEALEQIAEILDETPFSTIGELRDNVGHDLCHFSCFDYDAQYHPQWNKLSGPLFFADIDWRTVE